jgi:hypothetical protein
MRALTHAATPADRIAARTTAELTPAARPSDDATRPTGPVADALAGGRLLLTRGDDELDRLEAMLRSGRIDASERIRVGSGLNGELFRVRVHDPLDEAAPARWVVEKSAGGQAAQEEFGWRLARALGIDHLVAAAIRRADGAARIEYKAGRSLTMSGQHTADDLERALTVRYFDDAERLGISEDEARQAARIDRQLLQVFDYLLANNDRHGGNGVYDAISGAVTFIDSGHAGRGALAVNGGTTLEPALRMYQAGNAGGRIDLDPVVVDYLRRRLTPERIRELHAEVFEAPGIAGPEPRSVGERFIGLVRSRDYREGIVARLDNVLETGGYTHRRYDGDAGGELPPLAGERLDGVRGFRDVRNALHAGRF